MPESRYERIFSILLYNLVIFKASLINFCNLNEIIILPDVSMRIFWCYLVSFFISRVKNRSNRVQISCLLTRLHFFY